MHQFVHQLNNTELGKTGTHETYVSIPRGIVPRLDFLLPQLQVQYKQTGSRYDLVFGQVANGEYRLTGLGRLYREVNPEAGDLIIVEEQDNRFFIDFVFQKNVIVFSHAKDDRFSCRNEDRLNQISGPIPCFFMDESHTISIVSAGLWQPRKDSTRTVKLFQLVIDGEAIQGDVLNLFVFDNNKESILVPAYPDSIRRMEQA